MSQTLVKSLQRHPDPPRALIIKHLLHANEVGRRAMNHGHHPFGAILVGPDDETVLIEQGNVSTVEHADTVLLQRAARDYSADYLWDCTIFTSVEPCAMCAGTAYWANIGRFVFGMTEARLLEITGDHPENPTMSVGAKYVFDHGQKPINLIGPVHEVEAEVASLHKSYWSRHSR
jgi:tRNA(Arg) A34 adenosine deaminase TadA